MKSSPLAVLLLITALVALPPLTAGAFGAQAGDQLLSIVQKRALRRGDQGEQVAHLQRLLLQRGYDPGPVDGSFGPRTEQAVFAAQRSLGLAQDGLAGRLTLQALQSGAEEQPDDAAGESPSSGLVVYQAGAVAAGTAQVESAPGKSKGPTPTGTAVQAVQRQSAELDRATLAIPAPVTAGGASPAPAAPTDGIAIPQEPKEIALTFNHLPDEAVLVELLTDLADYGMKATFFVSGEQAEAHPDLLERIHGAGHEIGNLGYGPLDMRQLSPMTARAWIRRTGRAISAVTGQTPRYFRPPLGRFDRQLTGLVGEEGLSMVLWSNVAILPVPEVEPERLAEQLSGSLFPRMVLMLPLDRPNGATAVGPLLERMAVGGYRSRSLSDLIGTPPASAPLG